MTDRNRNQDPSRGEQQQSSEGWADKGSPNGSHPDVADDRGASRDRGRRSFNGDREHDELGSEMEDHQAVEDGDDIQGF